MNCGSAIRYFQQHAGRVIDIRGIPEAETLPGVKQISFVHGVGEKISDITDSGSRMGFVITQGIDPFDAEKKALCCMEKIRIQIK